MREHLSVWVERIFSLGTIACKLKFLNEVTKRIETTSCIEFKIIETELDIILSHATMLDLNLPEKITSFFHRRKSQTTNENVTMTNETDELCSACTSRTTVCTGCAHPNSDPITAGEPSSTATKISEGGIRGRQSSEIKNYILSIDHGVSTDRDGEQFHSVTIDESNNDEHDLISRKRKRKVHFETLDETNNEKHALSADRGREPLYYATIGKSNNEQPGTSANDRQPSYSATRNDTTNENPAFRPGIDNRCT